MRADFKVVLDACVLANFGVCDLLLTLAEEPRLYLPRLSDEILSEVRRTHQKLKWPDKIADSYQFKLRESFPESLVDGYDHILDRLTNDPKDRHGIYELKKVDSDYFEEN